MRRVETKFKSLRDKGVPVHEENDAGRGNSVGARYLMYIGPMIPIPNILPVIEAHEEKLMSLPIIVRIKREKKPVEPYRVPMEKGRLFFPFNINMLSYSEPSPPHADTQRITLRLKLISRKKDVKGNKPYPRLVHPDTDVGQCMCKKKY